MSKARDFPDWRFLLYGSADGDWDPTLGENPHTHCGTVTRFNPRVGWRRGEILPIPAYLSGGKFPLSRLRLGKKTHTRPRL